MRSGEPLGKILWEYIYLDSLQSISSVLEMFHWIFLKFYTQ